MQSLAKEVKQELTGRIVPFWEGLRDEEYGGFYGYQDFDLNVQKTYEKGCILNSRILWFFSNAYLTLKDEKLRADAEHAYRFMKQACVDREYGGVFWSVTYDGKPLDTTKHTYNQHLQFMRCLRILMRRATPRRWSWQNRCSRSSRHTAPTSTVISRHLPAISSRRAMKSSRRTASWQRRP